MLSVAINSKQWQNKGNSPPSLPLQMLQLLPSIDKMIGSFPDIFKDILYREQTVCDAACSIKIWKSSGFFICLLYLRDSASIIFFLFGAIQVPDKNTGTCSFKNVISDRNKLSLCLVIYWIGKKSDILNY